MVYETSFKLKHTLKLKNTVNLHNDEIHTRDSLNIFLVYLMKVDDFFYLTNLSHYINDF